MPEHSLQGGIVPHCPLVEECRFPFLMESPERRAPSCARRAFDRCSAHSRRHSRRWSCWSPGEEQRPQRLTHSDTASDPRTAVSWERVEGRRSGQPMFLSKSGFRPGSPAKKARVQLAAANSLRAAIASSSAIKCVVWWILLRPDAPNTIDSIFG